MADERPDSPGQTDHPRTPGPSALSADQIDHVGRLVTLGRVVPGAIHDLNNSLQVAAGLVELVSARDDLPADVSSRLQKASTHLARAVALVNDLRGLVRGPTPVRPLIDLRRVAERALVFSRYRLSRAGVMGKLVAPSANALPNVVRVDSAAMQQVVLELIENAVEALAGRPDGTVCVDVRRQDHHVVLTVADDGPGVPAAVRDRIFEPFFGTGATADALGLGLWVAREIVRGHAGRLTLGTSPQGGAVFAVELPVGVEGC